MNRDWGNGGFPIRRLSAFGSYKEVVPNVYIGTHHTVKVDECLTCRDPFSLQRYILHVSNILCILSILARVTFDDHLIPMKKLYF